MSRYIQLNRDNQPLDMRQCSCGKYPVVYAKFIQGAANRLNYFVRCNCGIKTRSRKHASDAVADWNASIGLYT